MSTLDQLPVVDTIADNDKIVINVGTKQRQISKSDFQDDLVVSGGFSIEQVTPTADYTPSSTDANEVWAFVDGDSYNMTLPNDSTIATGTKFIVFNTDLLGGGAVVITLASGATCPLVTSGTTQVSSNNDGQGYTQATFIKTGASSWAAFGDLDTGE